MDLADLRSLSEYKDMYKYLLNISDVFSRYAWSVPLKDKIGNLITAALKSLFQNRKQIIVQLDNGIEFVNTTVQQYFKRQGVSLHMTYNPDIKTGIIESFQRSLKSRMFKFFTNNNTNCYLDIINKLVIGYNSSVHSAIGMLPSKVTPSNIYSEWWKVNSLRDKIPQSRVKFKLGDLVRLTKEKVMFARGYEQTYSTERFSVGKFIARVLQPVWELSDLQGRHIVGQF